MPDFWMDVDSALSEVPVNIMPLLDDTDFKTRETGIVYNQAGMDMVWNFVTSAGAMTQTAVTPTTAGDYDWAHQGDGIYSIEIPASGGASINNDTEGYGWFTGFCTGVLPWRGPTIGFRAAAINDAFCDGGDLLAVDLTQINGATTPVTNLEDDYDGTGYDKSASTIGTTTTNTDMRGTDSAALASVCTEARLAELAAANLPADVDAVLADTNELQTDDVPGLIAALNDPTAAAIRTEMDSNSTQLAAIVADTNELQTDDVPGLIAALNDVSTVEVNAQVDAAIETYHLDHLLAVDYDPASKPGVGTALLNEIVENDGGVSRFTANALEQAPSAGTNPNVLVDTTIAVVTDQTEFTLTAGSNDDDAYNDQAIAVYDASDNDYPSVRVVTDYTGATKTVFIDSAPDFTIIAGDGVKIFVTAPGTSAPTAAQVADAVWDEASAGHTDAGKAGQQLWTDVDAILADTNELQTDDMPGLIGALNDPTAAAIRTEMDSNSTQLAAIVADTNELQTDDVPGLIGALNDPTAAAIRTEMDSNSTQLAAIVADTNELQTDWVNGGRLDLLIDAILADTNELQTDDVPGLIAALNNISTAEVNAEVLDVLATDAQSLPGQAAPTATPTLAVAIMYLYKAFRNKIDQDATTLQLYADDGSTVDQKATVSDDGSTYTRGEIGTGP